MSDSDLRRDAAAQSMRIERRFAAIEAVLAELRIDVANLKPLDGEVREPKTQVHALEKDRG